MKNFWCRKIKGILKLKLLRNPNERNTKTLQGNFFKEIQKVIQFVLASWRCDMYLCPLVL